MADPLLIRIFIMLIPGLICTQWLRAAAIAAEAGTKIELAAA